MYLQNHNSKGFVAGLFIFLLFFFIFRKTRHVLFGATIMYNKIHWCFGIPQKVKRKSLKPYKCYTCKFNNKTNQILKKFFSFYYTHAIISTHWRKSDNLFLCTNQSVRKRHENCLWQSFCLDLLLKTNLVCEKIIKTNIIKSLKSERVIS